MIELTAPESICNGEPIHVAFSAGERVSGRLRLTAGDTALAFTLKREGREPVTSDGPRVRGRSGALVLVGWPEQPVGSELVVRFEGAKCWIRVAAPE